MTAAADVDLEALDDREIVRLFGRVMLALRERDIVRSANNPIADIAEQLVAAYYGGTIAAPNEPSYDVLTANRRRLQVKALRRSQKGRTTLSPLRSPDFGAVVAVTFKPDLEVEAAFHIPLAVVEEYQRWSDTWKAHRLSLTKRLCADARVTRIAADDLIGEHEG